MNTSAVVVLCCIDSLAHTIPAGVNFYFFPLGYFSRTSAVVLFRSSVYTSTLWCEYCCRAQPCKYLTCILAHSMHNLIWPWVSGLWPSGDVCTWLGWRNTKPSPGGSVWYGIFLQSSASFSCCSSYCSIPDMRLRVRLYSY